MAVDLFSIDGRVILVTGAGRGIGAAVAAGLAQAGAVVHGLDLEFDETVPGCRAVACDVTDEPAVERVVDGIVGDRGRIDGLVSGAGVSLTSVDPYGRDVFLRTLAVNTLAPFRLGSIVARAMKPPAGRGGSIVNVTSLGAHRGFPDNPAYQASKAALAQLTRAMARDFGAWGVRVNSVCPGYVATAMNEGSYNDPDAHRVRAERTMLGRWGRPEDFVGPCRFLLSDASAFVTGVDLPVDGGWLAKGL